MVAVDRLSFDVPPGCRDRLGQVHHHAHDPRPGLARRRTCPHRWPALPPASLAAARGRRAAGAQGLPPGPLRPRSPGRAGGQQRDHPVQGGWGAGASRPPGRGTQAGREVLARHGAAPRHRRGAAGRPSRAAARRAGERPRPGGNPLDTRPAPVTGRRRPGSPGLQPPDQRNGPDGRPARGDRQRTAARRHHRRRAVRPGPQPRRSIPAT